MEAAKGDAPAPPELTLGWACERFHCLPEVGGYMDQDYGQMHRMASAMNVYAAYSHMRNSHGTAIHELSESERRILGAVRDMGLLYGNS